MSGNQKQLPTAPPQQPRCYTQPPPYPYQTFHNSNTNKHIKIGADGGFHVSPPATFGGPQQGPPQQQTQISMRSSMPPTGPPNQASTPPQADGGIKVPPMQTQPGSLPMAFMQQGTAVRNNQNTTFYTRPQTMQPPARNSNHQRQQHHIFQPPTLPVFTQIGQPVLPIQPYQTSYPARQQGYYSLSFPTPMTPTQPMYTNFSNQTSQPYFYAGGPPAPMNLIRAGPQQAPTGPQGPNQQALQNMALTQPHPLPPQLPPNSKKRRKYAIEIIDPNTGKEVLKDMFESNDSPPPESGHSSACETPQPESQVEITPDYSKINSTQQRLAVENLGNEQQPNHRTEILQSDAILHSAEEIVHTDTISISKINKKIEMILPSESKLQAETKAFVPELGKITAGPPRETPVVSASDGVEVIVCNKSNKERESPAKTRKARENAAAVAAAQHLHQQNIITHQQLQQQQLPSQQLIQQREPSVVQSVPTILRENEALYKIDISPQLANTSISQPHLVDSNKIQHESHHPHVLPEVLTQRDISTVKENIVNQKEIQSNQQHKEFSAHPPDTTLSIKNKHLSKSKTTEPTKIVDPSKVQTNFNFAIPQNDNVTGKNKNADSKKSISSKETIAKQSVVLPSTTSSTPILSQKQQPIQQQTSLKTIEQQQINVVQSQSTPLATAMNSDNISSIPSPLQQQQPQQTPLPVPVSQPAKSTNKNNKMRELNRKGVEKEGTDMDAFNTNDITPSSIPSIMTDTSNASNIGGNINTDKNLPVISQTQEQAQSSSSSSLEIDELNNKCEIKMLPKKVDVTSIVKDNNISKVKININDNVVGISTTQSLLHTLPTSAQQYTINSGVSNRTSVVSSSSNKENEMDENNTLNGSDKNMVPTKTDANLKVFSVNNANNNSSIIDSNKFNLPYKPGQWSPGNPSGKKVYDHDFLMALAKVSEKIGKKPNIPQDLELAIKNSNKQRFSELRYSIRQPESLPNMFPPYAKSQSQRGPLPKRNSQSKVKPGTSKPNVIHVSLSLKEDVKLNETENAWRPARLNKDLATMSEDDAKTAELYKKVRGVLNKLTPQKFDTLVSQVQSLHIDNCERLQGVIDLVFEKAIDEPNYSVAYALMCRELALMQVPAERKGPKDSEFVNFRKLLITRCQMEFEKTYFDEKDRNKKLQEIEEETDPEKKKELQLQLEDDDRRARLKSVGNVRFIGELFKQQMLTANIMMRCLHNLLNTIEEENLECLCKLLITVGKDLEIDKSMSLAQIFTTMQEIVDRKHGKISSRVRFMLQDVIDLRNNKWVPRRQDLKPTTIDQIQKEADNEQLNIQMMNAVPMNNTPRKDDRGGGSGSMSSDRKRGGGRNNISEDGWSMQPVRNRAQFTVESSKLKIKPILDEQLGSRSNYAKWFKGSAAAPLSQTQLPMTTTNMYSALAEHGTNDERTRQSGTRNGNKDAAYSSKGPSVERAYKTFEDGHGSRSGSQGRSRDGSQARQVSSIPSVSNIMPSTSTTSQNLTSSISLRPTPSAVASSSQQQPPKQLTDEQIETQTNSIIKEYLSILDVKECEFEIKKHFSNNTLNKFVTNAFMFVLEKSSSARIETGKLIVILSKNGIFNEEIIIEGLKAVLEIVDDLTIDIPKIWDYLSELIVPLLAEEVASLNTLKNVMLETLSKQNENYPGKLLVNIFMLLNKEKGPNFVRTLWLKSSLLFSDFVPINEVSNFIETNQLEYLSGNSTASAPLLSKAGDLSFDEIRIKLLEFFRDDVPFNDITEWVTVNVGDEKAKEKDFIRALVTAVCEHSIKKNKLNIDIFNKHFNLLTRYIDNKADREMQSLHALRAYITKIEHPPGLIIAICNQLWDSAVLSLESFLQWEKCSDPAEQEGKGVALKSLTSFFTALRETEDDSSTSEVEAEE